MCSAIEKGKLQSPSQRLKWPRTKSRCAYGSALSKHKVVMPGMASALRTF